MRPALAFLARRLAPAVLVVLGVSLLIFILARIMPGDPARLALGPAATAEQVTELRQQIGLDRPLILQYATFLEHALQFRLWRIALYGSARGRRYRRHVSRDAGTGF